MHLYNAWLPPPVASQTSGERDSFARLIAAVNSSFRSDDPDSVYSTLKFISVLDLSVSPLLNFPISAFSFSLIPSSILSYFLLSLYFSPVRLNSEDSRISFRLIFRCFFQQVLWCEVLENDVEFVIEGCEVLLEVTERLRSVRFMVL